MQTDELRAGLTELANEVAPFAGDVGAIRHRVARRRIAGASIAAVVVIGLIAGAIVATRPASHRIHVEGSPKSVELTQVAPFDAAVVLPVGATDDDIARVQAVLDASAVVKQYADLPAVNLAYALSFTPAADEKQLLTRLCAATPTRSFAVKLTSPVPAARDQLTTAIGPLATVASTGDHHGELEIFMNVKATNTQTDAIRAQLERDPDVVKFEFLDHQDAYKEFKKLFADQPVLIEGESPDSLPESFRIVELREGVSTQTFAQRFQGLPGVGQVNTPAENQLPSGSPTLDQICAMRGLRGP